MGRSLSRAPATLLGLEPGRAWSAGQAHRLPWAVGRGQAPDGCAQATPKRGVGVPEEGRGDVGKVTGWGVRVEALGSARCGAGQGGGG